MLSNTWLRAGESYQVDQAPQPVLAVEQFQDGTERKRDGKKHGGVAAAGRMRALQQPQGVGHHVGQDGMRQHAHLQKQEGVVLIRVGRSRPTHDLVGLSRFPYPLHGVLVIGQVVKAQRHPGGSHRRSGYFQQLLNASMSYKLCRKLFVQQQRRQVLGQKDKRSRGRQEVDLWVSVN